MAKKNTDRPKNNILQGQNTKSTNTEAVTYNTVVSTSRVRPPEKTKENDSKK